MSHARYEEWLAVYGDLDPAEREEVDRHLRACPQCAARLAEYRAIQRDLQDRPTPAPGGRLREGFYAAVARARAQDRHAGPWARLAQATLALGNAAAWAAVAAVTVLLLVGLALTGPQLARRVWPAGTSPARSAEAVPSPTPPAETALSALLSLHMVDEQNGWAVAIGALLHTTDGGRHWADVTPPGVGSGAFSPAFVDGSRAWAASAGELNPSATLYRTVDGGRTWETSVLSQTFSSTVMGVALDAADLNSAWLMVIPAHGMNSSPAALFSTTDGGAHWTQIASTSDTLPYGGEIRFTGATTGWLSGVTANTLPASLSVTRDGGRSWQPVTLALPPGYEDGRLSIGLPTFFGTGQQDGLLPAQYQPPSGRASEFASIVYATHDGGKTWQATTPVRNGGAFDFLDGNEGWVWSAEPADTGSTAPVRGTLYHTRDGARTWEALAGAPGLEAFLTHGGEVLQVDFVSRGIGWAIVRGADGRTTALVKTQDGGRSWELIGGRIAEPEAVPSPAVDGWVGTVVKLDSMAQFDDYFQRLDGERYGIDGSAAGLTSQIESARQEGTRIRVWGRLLTEVPDVGGRQIVVERLEVASVPGTAAPAVTPIATGASIQVSGWSPDGQWLAFWKADDSAPAQPYPAATLHFYNARSHEICSCELQTTKGSCPRLTWLDGGEVVVGDGGAAVQGAPCRRSFRPVDAAAPTPDPASLSPGGSYRVSTVYQGQGDAGLQATSTFAEAATGRPTMVVTSTLAWGDSPGLPSGPAGQWVTDRLFLINYSLDRGPLLVDLREGRVIEVMPELFGVRQAQSPDLGFWASAQAVAGSDAYHIVLGGGAGIEAAFPPLRLYHSETGDVEELQFKYTWGPAFSADGRWLLLDARPDRWVPALGAAYESPALWVRPVDPPGSPAHLMGEGQGARWSSDWTQVAMAGPGVHYGLPNVISVYSFPEGRLLKTWATGEYQARPDAWSPDGKRLAMSGNVPGEWKYALFIVEP